MNTPLEKAIKDLIRARGLLIDAEDALNQLSDYVVDLDEMLYSINKNLFYFRKYVRKIDESFYNQFLADFKLKEKH